MLNFFALAFLFFFPARPALNHLPGPTLKRSEEKPFIVGIFRPDGVIVPFARYAQKKWSNPWPNQNPGEPNTIADLTKPWYESQIEATRPWQVLLLSTGAQTVTTSQSTEVCSHCQKVWGLLSNYPNPKQPGPNECVVNIGIAFSRNRRASAMTQLAKASPDWNRIARFVGARFDQAEKKGLAQMRSPLYLAQIPGPEKRARTPLSMMGLYRARLSNGEQVFYFEARKSYSRPADANDAGCENISMLGGWIRSHRDRSLILLGSHFASTDCDLKESGFNQPFAILHLDGKTFAIVEEDGYEGESYTIVEIRRKGVRLVLETYGGSC